MEYSIEEVILPTFNVQDYRTDNFRHLRQNSLTWMRFHGTHKRKKLIMRGFDIIITTFETLVRQTEGGGGKA